MKQIILSLIILFIGNMLYCQEHNLFQTGKSYFDSGRYEDALLYFDDYLLESNTKHAEEFKEKAKKCIELLKAADDFYEKGNYKRAIEEYQRVLHTNLNPNDPKAKEQIKKSEDCMQLLKDADDFFKVGWYEDAKKEYEKVLKLNSNDSKAREQIRESEDRIKRLNYADNFYKKGDYGEAKKIYQVALNLNLGNSYAKEQLKKSDSCIELLKTADYLRRLNKWRKTIEAKEKYQKILALNPDDPNIKEHIKQCEEEGERLAPSLTVQPDTLSFPWKPQKGESVKLVTVTIENMRDFSLPTKQEVEKIDGFNVKKGNGGNFVTVECFKRNRSTTTQKNYKFKVEGSEQDTSITRWVHIIQAKSSLKSGWNTYFGLSAGYANKKIDLNLSFWDSSNDIHGVKFGVRFNPAFYGSNGWYWFPVGINFGVFANYFFAKQTNADIVTDFNEWALSIPIHLEPKVRLGHGGSDFFLSVGTSVNIGLFSKLSVSNINTKTPFYVNSDLYANPEFGNRKRVDFYPLPLEFGAGFTIKDVFQIRGHVGFHKNESAIGNNIVSFEGMMTVFLNHDRYKSWLDYKLKDHKNEHGLWQLTLGYVNKQWVLKDGVSEEKFAIWKDKNILSGGQAGILFSPYFGYGFGLNTGLLGEFYRSKNLISDTVSCKSLFKEWVVNIPIHLQYRFMFNPEKFNIFFYAGPSFDWSLWNKTELYETTQDILVEELKNAYGLPNFGQFPTYYEYSPNLIFHRYNVLMDMGIGIRFWGLEIIAGKSFGLKNLHNPLSAGKLKQNKNMVFSLRLNI